MSIEAADALMGIFGLKRIEGQQMKTVEETRRELFEAAYLKKYFYPADRWELVPEKYRTQHAEIAWWAFNAALDAVVIRLPLIDEPGYMYYAPDVIDAIESTNLGITIK